GGGYDQALREGKSEEEAEKAANQIFVRNLSMLMGTNIGEFALNLAPIPGLTVSRLALRGLIRTARVGGKLVITGLTESGEELYQEAVQRWALGQKVEFDEDMQTVMAVGFIGGVGFSSGTQIFGKIMENTLNRLPGDIKTQVQENIEVFKAEGMTEESATVRALDVAAETNGAVIEEATAAATEEAKLDVLEKEIKPDSAGEEMFWDRFFEKRRAELAPAPEVKQLMAPKGAEEVAATAQEAPSPAPAAKPEAKPKVEPELPTIPNQLREELAQVGYDVDVLLRDLKGKKDITSRLRRMVLKGTRRELATSESLVKKMERKEEVAEQEIEDLKGKLGKAREKVRATRERGIREVEVAKAEGRERVERVRDRGKEIEALRDDLYDYVKENLPLSVRGKLLAGLKNIRTEQGLEKALGRVEMVAEQYWQRTLRQEVLKEMRLAKPKKEGGILKGKFTPEVQAKLDQIRENLKMDRDEARARIAANIQAVDRGERSWEEVLEENEMLDLAGMNGMSSDELMNLLENIKSLKETGKTLRQEVKEKELAHLTKVRDTVVDVVTGKQGLKPGTGTVPIEDLTETKGWLDKLTNWQFGLDNLLDKLSKFHKSKPYESPLSKWAMPLIHDARQAQNRGIAKFNEEVRDAFKNVYGIRSNREASRILNDIKNKKVDLGTLRTISGQQIRLELTRGQIIKKYMEMLDPTLQATFEKMGWGYEITNAIYKSMSKEDIAWAEWQMDFYQRYYDTINPIYGQVYFVDMPHNPFYSPIWRDAEATTPENQLLYKDAARYASTANRSLKSRVESVEVLHNVDANDVLINHITQMEHFKAFALPIREARRVFGDKIVRTAIRQYHGRSILDVLDNFMNDIARDGIDRANINRTADWIRANYTTAVLGIKP
ncbi:MAG: hypothetical protein PHQ43_15025, partial [Dehalococcoidales bacterium]|nr:hypothetical protein [Dehalococcoidales bacterium]